MNFEIPVFGRRKPRDLVAAPVPTPRPRVKKVSFIAAARGILAAANAGPSALASRWQFVLQQSKLGKS